MNILLTPARIGPAEIPNRIVMPPMTTRGSDEEGHVTDQTIAYYMARVHGGVGLITVEMASPEKAGRHRRRELGIYQDEFIPGLTRLVGEIHRGGSKASIQLGHGGGHTRIDICGEQPVAPSAVPHPVYETTLETIIPEKAEMDENKSDVSFGSQIRSYVFQPYTMVNDHRTELKITDVQKVMDGAIDPFIEAFLKMTGGVGAGAESDG